MNTKGTAGFGRAPWTIRPHLGSRFCVFLGGSKQWLCRREHDISDDFSPVKKRDCFLDFWSKSGRHSGFWEGTKRNSIAVFSKLVFHNPRRNTAMSRVQIRYFLWKAFKRRLRFCKKKITRPRRHGNFSAGPHFFFLSCPTVWRFCSPQKIAFAT